MDKNIKNKGLTPSGLTDPFRFDAHGDLGPGNSQHLLLIMAGIIQLELDLMTAVFPGGDFGVGDVKMKKQTLLITLLIFCIATLAGCQGTMTNSIEPIREMRWTYRLSGEQQRLFSTFGFWVLDKSLRDKLLAAYNSDGILDRPKLREIASESQISEQTDCVRLVTANASFPEIWLADGWFIALEPKLDHVIIEMSEILARRGSYRQSHDIPIIPLGLNNL